MPAWLDALAAAERDRQPAVLVTVLSAKGSTPREAGTKMVVSADGLAGTIGGGNLEFQCEAAARDMLGSGAAGVLVRDFPLGPALGQCCGGYVSVLFEMLRPPALHIALFGAGHVGRALVRVLSEVPCHIAWIDSRPEALPAQTPANVVPVRAADPVQVVAGLPQRSVVLVMTHDHALDFDIVAACLARNDLPFVGLIGSDTKRARFAGRLTRLGVSLDRLVCPIGLPAIAGKDPAVIAVSVAAQVLQHASAGATTEHPPARPAPDRSCTESACEDCMRQKVAR